MYKSKATQAHIDNVGAVLAKQFIASGVQYTCRASVESVIEKEACEYAHDQVILSRAANNYGWWKRQFMNRAYEIIHSHWLESQENPK